MELKGNHHNSGRVITKSYFQLGNQYNHILLLQVPPITAMSTRFISYLNTFNQLKHLHRLDNCFYYHPLYYLVLRLATGLTVRGSNPGRIEVFRTHPNRSWGLSNLLYNRHQIIPIVARKWF